MSIRHIYILLLLIQPLIIVGQVDSTQNKLPNNDIKLSQKRNTLLEKAQKKVFGTITDRAGLPLPSVLIKTAKTENKTRSDFDGNYTINTKRRDTVRFCLIGYKTKVIYIRPTDSIVNIILEEGQTPEVIINKVNIDTISDTIRRRLKVTEKLPESIGKNQIQTKYNNSISLGRRLDMFGYLFFHSTSNYYNRNVLKAPVEIISLEKNVNNISNKRRREFYKILREGEILGYSTENEVFPLHLKDTLPISEESIFYKKNSIYNSIFIAQTTQDTLNGFYKITAKDNLQIYDYYLGYIIKGDPYIYGIPNVFEYYKDKRMVKRRFFVRDSLRGGMYSNRQITEDYFPLTKTKWRREIKTWPSEKLLVEDTVVYRKNKTYIDGVQKIYDIRQYKTYQPDTTRTERLLLKTHRYKKGRIQSVSEYSYYQSYQNFAIQQIKKLNIPQSRDMSAEVQKYDIFGRLLYRGAYKNVPLDKSHKNGCPNGVYKFDKYYTGVEPEAQCFQPIGKHYELEPYYDYSNGKRNATLDSIAVEYYGYFKKGVLVKYSMKGLYPVIKIKDSVTQKIYRSSFLKVYEKQVTDYKKRMSTIEYLSYPDKKLVLRIIKKYAKCMGGFASRTGWYEAFCEDESQSSKFDDDHKTKKFLEYYSPSGKKIIDEEFTGKYEDFLNNYYKN